MTHLAAPEWQITACSRRISSMTPVGAVLPESDELAVEQSGGVLCTVCERNWQAFAGYVVKLAERDRNKRAALVAETDAMVDRSELLVELIVQRRRARDILDGRDPDRPEKTVEQLRNDVERLRLANDEALQRMRASSAPRAHGGRRSTHLKAVR